MYDPRSDTEEELNKYRRWYNRRMKKLLNGNQETWYLRLNLTIFEAILIAAMEDHCRYEISWNR